jgi:CBS domain-containing protein
MTKFARDVMTADPACCTPQTTLDQVAKMMVQNNCGEIPVIDVNDQPIGVVTDRDIVCRVVAEGKNPMADTAETCMSQPLVTVRADDTLTDVVQRWRSTRFGAFQSSTNADAAPALFPKPTSRGRNHCRR